MSPSFNPIKALPVLLTAGSLLIAPVSAFWRMPCRSRSGLARIDPLVSNGTLSEHAHAIHGSSGFSTTAGYHDLLAGECTSCEVTQDKSAYWTPAFYFQNSDTGKFTLVNQVGGMLAYYLLYSNSDGAGISAFPAGFEMIAGDTNQRNFSYPVPDVEKSNWNVAPYNTQAFLRQAALGFNCLNYKLTPEGSLYRHGMPTKDYLDAHCTDGVRFELMFPSCWNGKDVTSKSKKDHVAYPSQVMTGDCPSDFPIRLPSLFYETIWDTYAFKGQAGQFVLANGDPTGFGYHGDFMSGWEVDFLQAAVKQCTNLSGQIEDCPLFTIQSSAEYSACNITDIPNSILKENVVGGMSSLPGNAAIAYGPQYAGGAAAGGNSAIVNTNTVPAATPSATAAITLSYSAGSSIASTDTYVPGAIFAVSSASVETFAPSSSPTPTLDLNINANVETSAPVFVAYSTPTETGSFFSTQYTTLSKGLVEEILWVEEVVTVTATEAVTSTVTTTPRSNLGRKRHLHQHKGR